MDPLLPQITACLRDSSLVVRRTTLVTLIHLLQEDYLKMSGRGAFFFRIVQALLDESEGPAPDHVLPAAAAAQAEAQSHRKDHQGHSDVRRWQ